MGLVDTIKRRYDLRQVDKYTKRRMSQSQFESRDRDYYNSIYVDGAYLQDRGTGYDTNSRTGDRGSGNKNGPDSSLPSSVCRPERWTLSSFLRRSSQQHPQQSLAAQQTKTSESYTMNG
ncbi:hypothetical protein BCR42DRAFT_407239 [Absidia repens]|uniref:Uncharacterized protein n=1 Tax=Absidia repens TaxID=90262 RepID=A0A1X2IRZ4_9FUNG|nr:hypothetical protein BCR42DRAFT_407239 [Absidia repens]